MDKMSVRQRTWEPRVAPWPAQAHNCHACVVVKRLAKVDWPYNILWGAQLFSISSINLCSFTSRGSSRLHVHEWHPRSSLISWAQLHIIANMQIALLSSLVLLFESRALGEAMSQTLGRPRRSFMVGFPAELSWLKGNEEVGRRDVGSGGDVWGWGGGLSSGGPSFWSF